MRRAALALTVAACGTPTPQLRLGLSGDGSQKCPSTDCMIVPMDCDAVMSIRIVDPDDTTHAFFRQCERVQPEGKNGMCSLRRVDLASAPIPVRKLDVQVGVYPASRIPTVPNSNELLCPDSIEFSTATGYPVEQPSAPALGGHTYYHPGDEFVDVVLGCTDLSALNDSCKGPETEPVSATVIDFATQLPVTAGPDGLADRLWVSVGEPHTLDGAYVLNPRDTVRLEPASGPVATWSAPISLTFNKYACIEVLEDVAQTTATLHCAQMTSREIPELRGVRIDRDKLLDLVKALSPQQVPAEGLTIGMVVDRFSNGVSGSTVASTAGSVMYEAGGTHTSGSGIFLSRDAPFGTRFSAAGSTEIAVGGLVAGKVTIVIVPIDR